MTLARKFNHSFGISAYESVPDAVREQRRSESERESSLSVMIRQCSSLRAFCQMEIKDAQTINSFKVLTGKQWCAGLFLSSFL